jgi:hypothetical protein
MALAAGIPNQMMEFVTAECSYRMKVQAVSTIGQFLYRVNLKVFQAYLVETGTDEEMSQDAVMGIIGSLFRFLVENSEGNLALVSLVLWTILGMK